MFVVAFETIHCCVLFSYKPIATNDEFGFIVCVTIERGFNKKNKLLQYYTLDNQATTRMTIISKGKITASALQKCRGGLVKPTAGKKHAPSCG
jgi:hypothetical protein